ncbi:MAG: hypothetical protein AMXMBFR82_02900 [Candidatus Hydrogenedentota bacterium]
MIQRFAYFAGWMTLAVIIAVHVAGCNTIRGVGRDIQAGGRAIERAAQN